MTDIIKDLPTSFPWGVLAHGGLPSSLLGGPLADELLEDFR